MSRRTKIAWIAGASVAGFIVGLVLAFLIVVQTNWFQMKVRHQIVTSVENATGGRAEVGGFSFRWQNLRATIHNFTIHGSEPAGSPPLLQIKTVEVGLNPTSPFNGLVSIASLLVDSPQVHLIIYPDGRTNIPAPKTKSKTNTVETIVNLAVGQFEIRNGTFTVASRKSNFNARGENLRAHLDYNRANPGYSGVIDVNPLFLQKDNNTPVRADVRLPVTIHRDEVALTNATITTAASHLTVNGNVNHIDSPNGRARIVGNVNLAELKRAAGLPIPVPGRSAPRDMQANVTVVIKNGAIGFENSRLVLGNSTIDLTSSVLERGQQSEGFRARLDLAQLGDLFGLEFQPRGTMNAQGDFTRRPSGYVLRASAAGKDLSLRKGKTRVTGIDLSTNLTAVPGRIDLANLRLNALGGSLSGSATMEDLRRLQLTGTVNRLDIDQVARAFTPEHLGYDGLVSGPITVQADLKKISDLQARANLTVAAGRRGIPVSGRLNLSYDGRADSVTIAPSRLRLPHSTLDLAGSLGRQVRVGLVTRDFSDFRPLVTVPVTLNGGALRVDATVTGSLKTPRIAGQAAMTDFVVDGRPFDRFNAAFEASPSGVSLTNAMLARGSLLARFDAAVGLRNWKALPTGTLRADAAVRNAGLEDALAFLGYDRIPATGNLTADAQISGTIGSPVGQVEFAVGNGTLRGAHFDAINGRMVLTDRSIEVPTLEYVAGPSRLQVYANYQHAVNQLNQGTLHARLQGNQLQLAPFSPIVQELGGLSGTANLQASIMGTVQPSAGGTSFQLTDVTGSLTARDLTVRGQNAGNVTASAATAGSAVNYSLNSDLAGSTIRVTGRTMLTGNNATEATASVARMPLSRLLILAGRSDLPLEGTITADARLSGPLAAPQIDATVDITKGSAWREPFSRAQATFRYTNQLIQVTRARIDKDGAYLEASGSFSHPAGDFRDGDLAFQLKSSPVPLLEIETLQRTRPVGGTAELTAAGAATLRAGRAPLFSSLNASLSAHGVTVNGQPMGDLTAGAEMRGRTAELHLRSDFAGSTTEGSGTVQLTGDYPIDARILFSHLTYSGLRPLLGTPAEPLQASASGQVTIAGPLTRPSALRGGFEITQLEARSVYNGPTGVQPRVAFEIHNDGPIRATLANSVVTVQNFRLAGPLGSVTLTGTAAATSPRTLSLRADGHLDLRILEAFDPDLFSSGSVTLTTAIGGTLSEPLINGTLDLRDASLNMVSLPNGISDANGTVRFSGREAVIENITGKSGGGDIAVTGYIGYGGPELAVRVQATGRKIHVNYPENVTTEINANLTLAGTSSRSVLSGNVSILDMALHSQTDIGRILNSAAAPKPVSTVHTGFLGGIHFDVRIETAPDAQFRTSLTQNLQADANLTLRGTFDQPGMLGRVVITEGEVVFFANRYRIEQGTIAFYNPQKINPYVNIDLDTTVSGVDVTISVTGPMDRLKLTYRSDPPLAFTDLLQLLASGRVNTTDPVLAARQPVAPQQSFEQAGASALLGQAVANPVAGTLQRLFGVTRLQINPQITGGTSTPQATLTMQQQISPDLAFTYIQDVAQSNPQIIKVEWTIDPQWSAVAQRDYNGFFYLDFFYKRRFW